MKRLKTFVHVSDLHIGELDGTSDDAALEGHAVPWMQSLPWFDGYLGHGGDALRHLESFFRRARTLEDAGLVVTGDLTTVGKPAEFDLAHRYLGSNAPLSPNGPRLGLNVRNFAHQTVPGNHDHWPGKRAVHATDPIMYGRPKRGSVPPLGCPTATRVPVTPDIELLFLRLDSDADVLPCSPARLFARARFGSQLRAARACLSPPAPGVRQVRVLLLHHSPSHRAFLLGMSRRMRADLLDFLHQNDIRLILSGHVHEPSVEEQTSTAHRWLEARCGTTLQRDTLPHGWSWRGGAPATNTLLLHRLAQTTDGSLVWATRLFVRTSRGFVADPRCGVAGFSVWP